MAELLLADLLDLLGHDGFTAVCHREQGGVFQSAVVLSEYAPAAVSDATGDVWFGVNPVQGPARVNAGRGTADDVVRLAAVYADLDVKPGGLPSMGLAGELIDVLSTMLNSRPSAMVLSGHGVQPYWPLSDGPSGPDARALLRRWGRLVAHVADMHGGQVDPVYDLSRVLRVPGTTNYKSAPVPVLGLSDVGHPLTVEELDERLVEYGAVELPGDRDAPGNIAVSPPANWQWAPQTCNYVIRMADGWAMDDPAARHPWLVAQATRIAAGHRYGCFDEAGYAGTVGLLVNRFRDLLVRGPESRKEVPGEIPDALAWGRGLAGAKTEAGVSAELGFHTHDPADADLTFNRGDDRPFEISPSESASPEPTPEQLFAKEVDFAAHRLRVHAAARELVRAEQAALLDIPPFDAGTLGEILQRPPEPPYRAEGLIPHEASALIVAMRKTGKTTLNLNLARSLIFGEDFLGRFSVRPITGNVGLLNYEVSSAQIARWAAEVGIPHDRLCIVNLRGRRNPLGNDEDKEKLAAWLRDHDCESLIVDPFGRAYTGVSQNDSGEVGAWLADLDRWARGEVGVSDLALSVHAGWEGERSRGASALEDWGDTIITLTRRKSGEDEDGDDEHRYLRAEGRDVDVDEDQLEYDPMTRLLTLTGSGGRKKASVNLRVQKLIPVVVEYVNSNPACSQRDLEADLPFRREDIRKAAEMAAARALIRRTSIGKGWSHMPNSEPEERVRPRDSVASENLGAPGAVTSQYADNPDNVLPMFQAQEEGAPHRAPVRPGRTASTAPPATIGAGRKDAPESACKNPAHSPMVRRGRWVCPDCDAEQQGESS